MFPVRNLFLSISLALAPCTPATPALSQQSSGIRLEVCSPAGVSGRALCGKHTVPLDWDDAEGPHIELSVVILPAADAVVETEAPPLFYLAGGPGGAATQSARAFQLLYPEIRRSTKLVLVDQRGTGGSNPVQCELEGPADRTRAMLAMDLDPDMVRACRSTIPGDPHLFGTPSIVRDLDAVREALGYSRINLLAQSYGTRVALAYIRAHEDRVRTATLQGVAPFALRLPENVAIDVDSALLRLSDKCTAHADCATRFGDVFDRVRQISKRLDETSVIVQLSEDGSETRLTRDVFAGGIRTLLYAAPIAQQIPRLIDAAFHEDYDPFVASVAQLAGAFSATLYLGAYLAVVCSEDIPYVDRNAAGARSGRTVHGPGLLQNHLRACDDWPTAPASPALFDPFQTNTPTLLLSGELDPVTPRHWVSQLKPTLLSSLHLVVPNAGHADAIGRCEDGLIARFVASGTLDGLDTRCTAQRPGLHFMP